MGQFIEFAKVLEKKLLEELLASAGANEGPQAPLSSSDYPHMSWLMAHTVGLHVAKSAHAQSFLKKHRRPPPPPKPHCLSREQEASKQFFLLHGSVLSPEFTKQELRRSFRYLARKLHPDLGGRAADFRALHHSYHCLLWLFA